MKKIVFIILFVFIYCIGNSQNTTTQNLGAPRTLVVNKGGLQSDSALILPSFPDTASANKSQYVKHYAGNVIRVGDSIYYRNSTSTKWVNISGGGGTKPNLQQVTDVGSTTGNEVIINNNLSVNQLQFRADSIFYGQIVPQPETSENSWFLPGGSGTLALTQDIHDSLNNYVPYTDATKDVELGSNSVTFGTFGNIRSLMAYDGAVFYDSNITNNLSLYSKALSVRGVGKRIDVNYDRIKFYRNDDTLNLFVDTLTSNRDIKLPNKTGTIALLSDIANGGIDSLKRSTDSVFAFKNGSWRFQYRDSIGDDTATVVLAYVTNAESTTITRGTVVYLFGASGDRASVKRANNKSDTTSSKTFAIVRDDITAGSAGYVVTQGQCAKLNLGSYSPGDIVYLDSISGQFTKNKPSAPYHSVFIGVVERANSGNGLLYIKPQNGYELGELHNVQVNSQNNNDVLYYDSIPKLWKAKSPYQLVDTSKLSARIDLRMKYTDTVSLSNRINLKQNAGTYLVPNDTTSLSNRINLKVNISDTSTMLSKYLRKTDTATLSSRIDTKGYAINFGATQSTILSATTYYFGLPGGGVATNAAQRRVYIPMSGTIKEIYLYVRTTNGTLGETWTISLRLNNTSNTTISSTANTSADKIYSNSNLNVTVSAGDYFEIITTTPATAPGISNFYGTLIIR